MSGYRANIGFGRLDRSKGEGPSDLPYKDGDKVARLPIFKNGISDDCISSLTKRFGVGVDISINRNRNVNYRYDLGLRTYTVNAPGQYEVDFTINGALTVACVDWIQDGTMSEAVKITKDSEFVNSNGETLTIPTGEVVVGYVKNGGTVLKTPITSTEFQEHKATIGETDMEIMVNYYVNLDGPRYFDIGYQQVNRNTAYGGADEVGVLCGCVIDSFTISYETGGDATFTFSISGTAMSEWLQPDPVFFDYNHILEDVSNAIMVTGCVQVYDKEKEEYTPIAQTDSASVTVSNNPTKLGACMKPYFSSVAIGNQVIELSTSVYSNDPNKYLSYMYGHKKLTGGTGGGDPVFYGVSKKPLRIPEMVIVSNDAQVGSDDFKNFIKIHLYKVNVGTANRTLNAENSIMEEPDLRPATYKIVTGYTKSSELEDE